MTRSLLVMGLVATLALAGCQSGASSSGPRRTHEMGCLAGMTTGAVVGGLVGSTIGRGSGRTLATAAGIGFRFLRPAMRLPAKTAEDEL